MGNTKALKHAILGQREGLCYVIHNRTGNEKKIAQITRIKDINEKEFFIGPDIEVKILEAIRDCDQKFRNEYELFVKLPQEREYFRIDALILTVKQIDKNYYPKSLELRYEK